MPLKHTSYTFDTYVIPMTIKDSSYQCLGECIHQVIHRRYFLNHYITPLNYLKKQMLLSLNVFTFLAVSCFSRLCHNLIDITKQNHGLFSQGHNPSLIRNFLSQMAFFTTLEVAMYSTSIVESTMQNCFTHLQLIVAPPKVKTKLKVAQPKSLSN